MHGPAFEARAGSRLKRLRCLLFSPGMDELGEFETRHQTWSKGDEFVTADGRWFRIVALIRLSEDVAEYGAFWVVEPGSQQPRRGRLGQRHSEH
jgi:hypothetical protein